jgi:enoyl-CoA hydratase/carnithine racemase
MTKSRVAGSVRPEAIGRVRLLTLDRPAALNAFDQQLYDEFTDALLEAGRDEDVSVIVLTGAGRAFSAGTDLRDLQEHGDFRRGPDTRHGFDGLMEALVAVQKPFVCAVNGLAVGLGATVLGHADLVFMADTARVRCPFTSLGLAPEAASSATFPHLLGRQNAAWVLLSSAWLDAQECLRAGLAFRVVPDKQLLPVTLEYAQALARHPLQSLVATKQLLSKGADDSIRQALTRESAAFDLLLSSRPHQEALRSFHERQPAALPATLPAPLPEHEDLS